MMQLNKDSIVRKMTLVAWLALSVDVAAQQQATWHPIADIAQVAESFVANRLKQSASRGTTTVNADMLDERLRLAACEQSVEAFLRPGVKISAKTVVGVRCHGPKPWKVYVPVQVAVHDTVWVARHSLARGHLLTKADLAPDERDISRMNGGFVLNPEMLIGRRLRQAMLAGRAFTAGLVEADNVVHRGQTVTLAITTAGITIRMAGKAMMDGALNQRIRVENLNSGRIIEGIVRSRELVEIPNPAATTFFHAKPKGSPTLADT